MLLSGLLVLSSVLLILGPLYAQEEPEEGKNYVWIDLGKKNEGFLLTQAEQGDGITEEDIKGDVDSRKLPFPYNGPGHNHMYFRIDDSFIRGGDHEVWIVMEYFDVGVQINCQYDSNGAGPVGGAFRGSGAGAFAMLKPENTETWKTHVWHITDGRFENRGNGSDFRFSTHAAGDMWVNRVWLLLFEPPDPFDPEDPFGAKARAVQPGDKSATTWGSIKAGY
jgi:hypothetical protein